ncbi:MAG: hypothetical protein ACTS6J_14590 [Burkholderiales bacterium]
MTADEFRAIVNAKTDADLLGPCFRDDTVPYVFQPEPGAWPEFRLEVGNQLGVEPTDLRIVGSGRLGFSLKPWNNLKAYSDTSDIDLLVVSPNSFDQLWFSLLSAFYPRPPVTNRVGSWLKDRKNELYTGWISPLDVRSGIDRRIHGQRAKAILEFSALWFNTLKKAARHVPTRHEDIKARLYRTWSHADMYHLHSTASLRKALEGVL